jgi:hypothetical protein
VHFVDVLDTPRGEMPVTFVLVRRRSRWQAFRAWVARHRPRVLQSRVDALEDGRDADDPARDEVPGT